MLLFSKLNLYASNTFLCFITADLCSYFAYLTMDMVIGLLCTHIAIWYYGYFYGRIILKGPLIVLIMAKVVKVIGCSSLRGGGGELGTNKNLDLWLQLVCTKLKLKQAI